MPLLLIKYWKQILGGGLILGAVFYVGILKLRLAHDELLLADYKMVQVQNKKHIEEQNSAIKKMSQDSLREAKRIKETETSTKVILEAYRSKSTTHIPFVKEGTCNQDVQEFYRQVRKIH